MAGVAVIHQSRTRGIDGAVSRAFCPADTGPVDGHHDVRHRHHRAWPDLVRKIGLQSRYCQRD